MDYEIHIIPTGTHCLIGFPDLPGYAGVHPDASGALTTLEGHLQLALIEHFQKTGEVPAPKEGGALRIKVDDELLLRFSLCKLLTKWARIAPEVLEEIIYFLPEPDDNFLDVALDYSDESVLLTFLELGVAMDPTGRAMDAQAKDGASLLEVADSTKFLSVDAILRGRTPC